MDEAFADTAGWAALFVEKQVGHDEAVRAVDAWINTGKRLVTTSLVLAEFVALAESPLRVPRSKQVAYVEAIRAAPWVEIIHVDAGLQDDGWNLFKARLDKTWSLVDCVSFVLMQDRGILQALTRDHHFEQAGFVRLLA